MIVRVREFWIARSIREQRLLGVAALIALPLILWLGIAVPLAAAYDAARERHAEAVERHARIISRADAFESGGARAASAAPSSTPIALIVADAASQAGFTLDTNSAAGPGSTSITIASARPTAVVEWLAGFEGRGIAVDELRITPGASGTVAVTARLSRTGA